MSKTYSSPIEIRDISNDPDRLARTFLNGVGLKTIAKTFFVWSGVNPYNTPIISMQANEKDLFGYENGIYTAGIDFDTWRAENPDGNQPSRPSWNNYWRSEREWEKPVNAGLRIHSNTSRADIIKNLGLYARSEYDDKNEFRRILLRGNGTGGYIANNDIPYATQMMRGLQIKQPFKSGSLENTLQINTSTYNYTDIKISFAVSSNGAAESIVVDYWNGSTWVSSGISYEPSITTEYQVKEIDFSIVDYATNNEDFKVRIRFTGANMFADEGEIVQLNNMAISGKEDTLLYTEIFDAIQDLKVFPNPTNDQIKIQGSQVVDEVSIYNVFGKLVYTDAADSSNLLIDMSTLSSGAYLLKISSNNTSMNRKIIKK
ncbi:MAG: hypothetical protein ACJA1B_000840 [Polaribacter sp.]|jgi:hypothetical protein